MLISQDQPAKIMKTLSLLCSLGFLLCLSACAGKPQPPTPHSLLPQQPMQQQAPPQSLPPQRQPQQKQQKESPQKNTGIIGTWQWVLDNGSPVSQLFFIRYYANGKAASWPSPKDWSDSKGVSHGRYSVTNNILIIETGSAANNPKSQIEIQDQDMLVTTASGHQLVYRRVTPGIDPGKLPNGKPAGFAHQ